MILFERISKYVDLASVVRVNCGASLPMLQDTLPEDAWSSQLQMNRRNESNTTRASSVVLRARPWTPTLSTNWTFRVVLASVEGMNAIFPIVCWYLRFADADIHIHKLSTFGNDEVAQFLVQQREKSSLQGFPSIVHYVNH
jgi:hypothetical protein